MYLGLQREGRFPCVDSVAPSVNVDTPTLELGANDREFVLENLKRLPDGDGVNQPLTVDLKDRPTLRARYLQSSATELVLTGSQRSGGEVCVATDRRHLERAVKLGFPAMTFTGTESPVVCRDGYRTFVWAVLHKSQIVPTSPDAVVIETVVAPKRRRLRNAIVI